jgi:hypothetical protein
MFRFTIRDVLWLMVVVGVAIGWWIDHATPRTIWQHRAEAAARVLREQGWDVSWRYDDAAFKKDGLPGYSFHFSTNDLQLKDAN